MEGGELIRKVVTRLSKEISISDFDVKNETELAHLFYWAWWEEAKNAGVPLNSLRSEIPLRSRGRIDFGLRHPKDDNVFELCLELKVWVRPLHASRMSKANVATRKRNECIKDAQRLSKISGTHAGLLVLERNSTHLQRELAPALDSALGDLNVRVAGEWFDLARQSQGEHKEHIGLIWLHHFKPDAPDSP